MRRFLILALIALSTLSLSISLSSRPLQAKWKTAASKSPSFSASVAKNKRSVTAKFSNLSKVKTVAYQLTYDSNKGPQGAGGSIKITSTKNQSRTLLFGTCSHGVCSYHTSLKNARLSVDFTLKSGGVVSYEKVLIK